jgi:hypothetical protein
MTAMPKARPVSLHPLSFKEALTGLLKVKPVAAPKRRRRGKKKRAHPP